MAPGTDWLPLFWKRQGWPVAFGTMALFGLRRAFGLQAEGMVTTGPYRFSRNPQLLGGWLMVLGMLAYQPSLYALGWVLIWALIGHWMITVEEEHLQRLFGEAYQRYRQATPRYLLW
jgi:protein-S-isoprenylcysteine O-methyltransferase Ste14